MKELESTSYHEAGHAVVAHRLGKFVKKVDLFQIDGDVGHCYVLGSYDVDDCIHILAGYVAQIRFDPDRGLDPSVVDFKTVKQIVDSEGMDGTLYRTLLRKAQRMVKDDWPAIQAVATALVRFERITGTLVKEIVQAVDQGEDHTTGWEWQWHEKLKDGGN